MGSRLTASGSKAPVYLQWLHELRCVACGRTPVHAHHVRRFGERRDDRRVVPLCATHHLWDSPAGIHRLGRRVFETQFGIDLETLIRRLNAAWEKRSAKAA